MALLKTISGIRGTIGGKEDEGLTPFDIMKYATSYAFMIKERNGNGSVVIGRDARLSGTMVNNIVCGALMGAGIDVIDLGLSTTPTVEMAVVDYNAIGGIILTASHNPKQWNALKLLNSKGEFISAADGEEVLKRAENLNAFDFPTVDYLGSYTQDDTYAQKHIDHILNLELVDVQAIKKAKFKVVVDAVNSTGGIYVPMMLRALGVKDIIEINCEPTGIFAHNPEPKKEHLTELSNKVKREKADLGITVDPDVDRLAFVSEDGEMFGEEYTLVAVSEYVLRNKKGATVSNLSSTMALKDVTEKEGCAYFPSAVGEVNVVAEMKKVNAVIGGEGNGGIIYPELHYGRDALVGIALFLSHLALKNCTASELRDRFPKYCISKNKIQLTPQINVDFILTQMAEKYKDEEVDTTDGVKIYIEKEWVHLRKSNTEPIIRIYSESRTLNDADALAARIKEEINALI